MSNQDAMGPGSQPVVNDRGVAFAVYVLYLVGFVTGGLASIVGLIIAYIKGSTTDPVLQTHFQFQIRTFWIGLLYVVVAIPLCFVIIGFFVFIWWAVWTLVRCIKGLMALNEGRPIAQPRSWMFG